MTCAEYREVLMDDARGVADEAVRAHIRRCAACERALQNQRTLSAALARLAKTETREPSAALERTLLSRVRPDRVAMAIRAAKWAVPIAAAAAAAAWLLFTPAPRRAIIPAPAPEVKPVSVKAVPPVEPRRVNKRVGVRAMPLRRVVVHSVVAQAAAPPPESEPALASSAFVMIPYEDPPAPTERADVVRVNMPVSAAVQLGMPFTGADPAVRLDADLLLGENGVARAYRLVRVAAH